MKALVLIVICWIVTPIATAAARLLEVHAIRRTAKTLLDTYLGRHTGERVLNGLIRGGGGNFGVVTQFEFKLYPVGPEILARLIVFPFDQAKQVLTKYREFVESAPRRPT